ncbi:MAG: hypothetical protein ACTSUF_10225 [Candidatus Heimdallarchaeaceae archaeon]
MNNIPDKTDTPYDEWTCNCGICDWCFEHNKDIWLPDTQKEKEGET